MATRLETGNSASEAPGNGTRGRGARGFGARVMGVLLLALGLGLGYAGVMSGLYEPFAKTTQGTLTVEHCRHDDGRYSRKKECEGTFRSEEGRVEDPYADVATDDPYPKGHRIDVLQIGDGDYATSIASGVASGLRPLFGGLCVLGPAFFCLVAGRWPSPRAAGALRSLPAAFSWITFSMVGIGLLGLLVASIVKWGM